MNTKTKLIIYYLDGKMKEVFNLDQLMSLVKKEDDIDRLIVIEVTEKGDVIFERQFAICG